MKTRILRVFPHYHKQYTPNDPLAFVGVPPGLLIPEHDEVHVSCVFTWDKAYCEYLAYQWEPYAQGPVKLGGPAFGSSAEDFTQGLYLKSNIIFTSRGCNNTCPWCCVPKLEGSLRELPVCPGNWIQDNNFLQTSRTHKDKVFDMLRTQRGICFKGGLECELIDDHFCDALQSLYYTRGSKKISRISELWLACDTDAALPELRRAAAKLTRIGFDREKIMCYTLIGDDMDKNEARCREIYHAGAMPRAQLYRDFGESKTAYSDEWKRFERQWTRPSATKKHMEYGTHWREYHT